MSLSNQTNRLYILRNPKDKLFRFEFCIVNTENITHMADYISEVVEDFTKLLYVVNDITNNAELLDQTYVLLKEFNHVSEIYEDLPEFFI